MQVWEVDRRPHLTEDPVTKPAEEGQGPPQAREEAQLEHTEILTPGSVDMQAPFAFQWQTFSKCGWTSYTV